MFLLLAALSVLSCFGHRPMGTQGTGPFGKDRKGQEANFGGSQKKLVKNHQKPLKSLKIATLAVRKYSRSTQNEKLTLDKSSKYDFDSENAIL